MLNRNVIKQNVMFLSITILLFILFGTVLYVGSSQIYEREAKWQHGKTTAQLVSGKKIIEEYFSWSAQNLLFLRDLPNTKDYADSDFESSHYKKIEEKIFRDFARVYKKYSQIKIIDASGHEIVRINKHQDDTTIIVPDSDLRDHRHHPHFQETMKLDKDQMCSSPIGVTIDQEKADGPCISVISFATPLFNSENEKNGILILDISFSEVLEVLPKNMFIQTEEGNIISLKQDGSVNFATSDYIFHDSSGWLYLSDVETIHYATVEFLPGKRFIVAMFHSHPLLKAGLQRLIWVSVLLLALFICLILVIGYINFSRFWALIEAQKAIIFSLVRLTEIRDQETGDHLERTRNYTIILARQLRKKKKYRKILKNEFLEDLYDAASLHDIGKVGIRDAILLKKTMLSDEEYKEMAEHPRIGKQVLQDAIDTFVDAVGMTGCVQNVHQFRNVGSQERVCLQPEVELPSGFAGKFAPLLVSIDEHLLQPPVASEGALEGVSVRGKRQDLRQAPLPVGQVTCDPIEAGEQVGLVVAHGRDEALNALVGPGRHEGEGLTEQPVGGLTVTNFACSPVNHLQGIAEMGEKLRIGIVLSDSPLLFSHRIDIAYKVAFIPRFVQFSFQFQDDAHGFVGATLQVALDLASVSQQMPGVFLDSCRRETGQLLGFLKSAGHIFHQTRNRDPLLLHQFEHRPPGVGLPILASQGQEDGGTDRLDDQQERNALKECLIPSHNHRTHPTVIQIAQDSTRLASGLQTQFADGVDTGCLVKGLLQQHLGGTDRHIAGKGGRQNRACQPLRRHFAAYPIVLGPRLWGGQPPWLGWSRCSRTHNPFLNPLTQRIHTCARNRERLRRPRNQPVGTTLSRYQRQCTHKERFPV